MQPFIQGMYVRFAIDNDNNHDFRDFRLGKLVAIDELSGTVTLRYQEPSIGHSREITESEQLLTAIRRCHIMNDSIFTYLPTGQVGRILTPVSLAWIDSQLMEYFVLLDGATLCIPENTIWVLATTQDPDPWLQLKTYEFHSPIWRGLRNNVIESISELRNATFGLEDLVGSRVMLFAHQAEVVAKVLSDTECRYILADEVGLGKTIEASVILKGLRRRHAQLKTLIVTPSALIHQWHHELNHKFWLDFISLKPWSTQPTNSLIVTTEELQQRPDMGIAIYRFDWDLLIIDEAHHISKDQGLYDYLQGLSNVIPKVLLLSATPIQQHVSEYLTLLQLLDPHRYASMSDHQFKQTLDAQQPIRRTLAYLQPTLSKDKFDCDEFVEEMEELRDTLMDDPIIPSLMEQLPTLQLEGALAIVAYISENYRLESRVIRNRRASLQISLPQRIYDARFCYYPSTWEAESLEQVYDYVTACIQAVQTPLALEYARIFLAASASSPNAVLDLITQRRTALQNNPVNLGSTDRTDLLRVAAPRVEQRRIGEICQIFPMFPDELRMLESVQWQVEQWADHQTTEIASIRRVEIDNQNLGRFGAVIQAIRNAIQQERPQKSLLFSSWPQTLNTLVPQLKRIFGADCVAEFRVGIDDVLLEEAVHRFQESADCLIMVCDELGGEGRNFQIAAQIIHVDVPWTPAQIEQRIGRVDRLGRDGQVCSVVPYAQETIEADLVHIWDAAFQLFSQSMSGLEIALEGILQQIMHALQTSVRNGLHDIFPQFLADANTLRNLVEEERYFEEGAINRRLREQFLFVSKRYSDGSLLGKVLLKWAHLIGIDGHYNRHTQTVRFNPRDFHDTKMTNARFIPPKMIDAHRRSGRLNNFVIEGTFNRDLAIRNERLVFYAPGDDPWTDALIRNAIETDRGRSCAIRRTTSTITEPWHVFDLFYTVQIDPRPLFSKNLDPTHLFRAQGYLSISTMHVYITSDGKILSRSNPIRKILEQPFNNKTDQHLGKRGGETPPLLEFKRQYLSEEWHATIAHVQQVAEAYLNDELSFMHEFAAEAQTEFDRRVAGWRAAHRRLFTLDDDSITAIAAFEEASAALSAGLGTPLHRLESACFWVLEPNEGMLND